MHRAMGLRREQAKQPCNTQSILREGNDFKTLQGGISVINPKVRLSSFSEHK
jgi:hypothetical protein